MGFFDFLKPAKPARVQPPPLQPVVRVDPDVAVREAVEVLRPHLMPACFGTLAAECAEEPDVTASKVGGVPYAEAGETWPHDERGRPMVFLMQVNSAEVTVEGALPVGLCTVFADARDMEECDLRSENGTLVVRHYKTPDASTHVPLQRPADGPKPLHDKGVRLIFQPGFSLPDSETVFAHTHRKHYEAITKWESIHRPIWYDSFRQATKILVGELPDRLVVQVGGHPQWVQSAESPRRGYLPHEWFTMQINTGHRLGISWGDEGAIYIYGEVGTLKPYYAVHQCS